MAQYYQVVSQPDKSQDEPRHQYYANDQQTVQYVLTHEDPQQTFQGQQIMVNNQLMVVDNSIPPVIVDVDPSQIQYQPEYVVQDAQHVIYNEDVDTGQSQGGDMQQRQPVVLNHMQPSSQKILLSLHQSNRPNNQEMTQQTASILNTGHMAAQIRQSLHQGTPQDHQMVQQVYRNAVQANQQQVGVHQRPTLTLNQQQNLLNSQQQIGVGVGVGRAGATALLRLPITVAGGASPMRAVLQQHQQQQQQLQVGGVRIPGAVAMGRGVVRGAVGMLQQTPPPPPPMQRLPTSMVPQQQRQTTPQQQQMMQRAQLQHQQQQQLGQQPQQQATGVASTTGNTLLQSNVDNKVVQLEDGTLVPIAAYKQMMFNQDQSKQQAIAATAASQNPKPPPKRRAPAKPRAPKKTAAQIAAAAAANNDVSPAAANQLQQQQQQTHPAMNANPIYPPPTQSNQPQPQTPPQVPNQSAMNSVTRTINSIASGMIQNANPEDASGVSTLANFVPSAQIQTIIANTLKNDNYSDSIRMLVLLENGEQRLITFTMPREQCTIQEILEQVNVPFRPETKIEMVEMNCNGLNYVVGVGDVKVNMGTQPSCQPPVQPSHPPPPTNPPAPIAAATHQPAHSPLQPPQAVPAPPVPTVSPPPTPELPKLVPGRLAICNHCGYLSEDFNRCSRCKRKFPELVKSMAASDVYKNGGKPPQGVSAAEIASAKLAVTNAAAAIQTSAAAPASKPAAKKKVTKHKIPEPEPVVLLSSDEDDEDEKMKYLYEQVHKNVNCNSMKKEPTSVEITEKSETVGNLTEAVHDPDLEGQSAILECRTVRVGSFRYSPMENFSITAEHITFKAPTIDHPEVWRSVEIDKRTIVKVLVNFNRLLPVIFYYVTPNAARTVREALNMLDEDSEPYFDPLGKEEAFKRITVLPENFTEAMRSAIKLIYSKPTNILEELSSKEANDILVRTCPRDIKKTVEASNCFTEIRQLLIYPPGKGGISINTEDYMCLAQDQFLNDVIIDFYLQHLVLNLPPEEQEKIHVFSTFFYIRLTTKPIKASRRSQPAELDPSLTPAQKRHARVKNWTKKVDLFDKDFVIIPINESCHWFLAIICYPGMIGYHTMDNVPIQKDKLANLVKKNPLLNTATSTGAVTITQIKKEKFDPKKIVCEDGSTSDKDEAEGDDSEFDSLDGEAEPEEPAALPNPKERVPIKQPCILIFDSLAGASRCRVVATLRDYLTCEFKIKRNMDRSFNKDTIKGACPKVPQQTNYTDCGLYLLQYVESFLRNPIKDYHIPINGLKGWFEEMVVTKKREDISNLIRELMVKHGKDPDMLPEILLPTLNGELFSNYEDEPDEEEDEEDEETGEIVPKSKDAVNGTSKNLLNAIESEDCNSTADDSTPDTDSTPPVRIVRKLWPPPPPISNNNSSSESPNPSNSATEDNMGSPSHTPEIGSGISPAAGLVSTQSPSMSSSHSASSLSPGAVTDNNSSTTPLSDLGPITAIVADVLKEKPTTDRETMSYLKSKRIVRHKPNSSETKKFKPSYPTES